jgi:hypothetical protein
MYKFKNTMVTDFRLSQWLTEVEWVDRGIYMFRRYMLPLSSGSNCAGWINFCVHKGSCRKPGGGGWGSVVHMSH